MPSLRSPSELPDLLRTAFDSHLVAPRDPRRAQSRLRPSGAQRSRKRQNESHVLELIGHATIGASGPDYYFSTRRASRIPLTNHQPDPSIYMHPRGVLRVSFQLLCLASSHHRPDRQRQPLVWYTMGQARMGQHMRQHSTSGRALRDENKASAPYDLLAREPTEVVRAGQPIACTCAALRT